MLEPHTAGRCEGPPVGDLSVDSFLSRCLLFDLGVDRDQKIYHMGALLGDKVLERKGLMGPGILRELDAFGEGADFVLAHNISRHDLPILQALAPNLVVHRGVFDFVDERAG